jgi:hypothetical protein
MTSELRDAIVMRNKHSVTITIAKTLDGVK